MMPILTFNCLKENVKILLVYDGSKEGERAVREEVTLSKKFNASITLLHVYWDPGYSEAEEEVETFKKTPIVDQGELRILDDMAPFIKDSGVEYTLRSETHP